MDNDERLIRDFMAAWGRGSAEELAAFFTEDGVYHNIPDEPIQGRENILASMRRWLGFMSSYRIDARNLVSAGGIVMAERVDHLTRGGRRVALPVVGVFEVESGKIRAMRDYYDPRQASGAPAQ